VTAGEVSKRLERAGFHHVDVSSVQTHPERVAVTFWADPSFTEQTECASCETAISPVYDSEQKIPQCPECGNNPFVNVTESDE